MKLKRDGLVDYCKARLVAKDFRQRENIGLFDTYSPVTRITYVRMLIFQALIHNLIEHKMDVLDPTLPTSWDSCASLPVNQVRNIDMLLKEL